MWHFADLRLVDHLLLRFMDLRFADPIFFCGFKTSTNPQTHINFRFTNINLKCSHSNYRRLLTLGTVLRQSYIEICSLKFSYVGEEIYQRQTNANLDQNTALFKICGFAICGLGHQGNLRICDLHHKFTDSYFRTGTTRKFSDLRFKNEAKNLRLCDLQTDPKNVRAHLCNTEVKFIYVSLRVLSRKCLLKHRQRGSGTISLCKNQKAECTLYRFLCSSCNQICLFISHNLLTS